MTWGRYRFHSRWELTPRPATSSQLCGNYSTTRPGGPQVRAATQVDDDTCWLTIRSTLPYNLRVLSRRTRDDDAAGTLEAALSGDLEGMSRWTISRSGPATLAVFDEDVVARKALIRTLGPVARPAFRANHAVMMAAGKRGLVAYLAGMRLGRSLPVPP